MSYISSNSQNTFKNRENPSLKPPLTKPFNDSPR
nr:MAG TPA: hypothetical protein [Caudoviricetes sp.]